MKNKKKPPRVYVFKESEGEFRFISFDDPDRFVTWVGYNGEREQLINDWFGKHGVFEWNELLSPKRHLMLVYETLDKWVEPITHKDLHWAIPF